jgi:hypothetical protein
MVKKHRAKVPEVR